MPSAAPLLLRFRLKQTISLIVFIFLYSSLFFFFVFLRFSFSPGSDHRNASRSGQEVRTVRVPAALLLLQQGRHLDSRRPRTGTSKYHIRYIYIIHYSMRRMHHRRNALRLRLTAISVPPSSSSFWHPRNHFRYPPRSRTYFAHAKNMFYMCVFDASRKFFSNLLYVLTLHNLKIYYGLHIRMGDGVENMYV